MRRMSINPARVLWTAAVCIAAFLLLMVAVEPAVAKTGGKGPDYAACAKACLDCNKSCRVCYTHCKGMARVDKKHVMSMRLTADTADICIMASRIVGRKGPMSAAMCRACVTACDSCAAECGKYPAMTKMKQCVEACNKCSSACRAMLKAMGKTV
jgi:hypothetical protein